MTNFKVNPNDYDHVCYIVAGGPSLIGFDWSLLTGKFVVAINRSYEVLPEAQVLYFTDPDYWDRHKDAMRAHKGQMIKGDINPKPLDDPDVIIYRLTRQLGLETKPGCLSHGSNSTYAATNLVTVHFGFRRVYLLGVDMKWGKSGDKTTSHWHNGHRRVDAESSYKTMIKNWETIVAPLRERGVEVWNANPDSALHCFPKCTLDQAINNVPPK